MLGGLAAFNVAGREAALERRIGGLVDVVVAHEPIRAGQRSARARARDPPRARAASRRAGAVGDPQRARRAARAAVDRRRRRPRAGDGRRRGRAAAGPPVGAASASRRSSRSAAPQLVVAGSRVDVLVTPEPRGDRPGEALLALEDVEVIAARAPAGDGRRGRGKARRGARVVASLRVTLRQAVYLAAVQDFARELRLLPRAAGDRAARAGAWARTAMTRCTPAPYATTAGTNSSPARSVVGTTRRDDALDALAATLRERLLAEAGERRGVDPHERIRALVDREAGLLDAATRARARGARRASARSGSGRWSRCSPIPTVDEVMVNGPGQVWVERAGRIEPTAARFATRPTLRHAIERILAPLGRRVDEAEPLCDARLPDGSRVNVVVAAAGARRPGPDDPPLSPARLRPRRPRRQRHVGGAAARPARAAPCAPAATSSSAAARARARRRRSTR